MKLTFNHPTGGTKEIEVKEESTAYRSIKDGNKLMLSWDSEEPINIPLGSTVEVEGYTYTLYYPVECKKVNTKWYEYQATLHGKEEELKFIKIKDVGDKKPSLKFVLTGKPTDFVRFVAKSMGKGWKVGQVIEGVEKTMAFSHEYCWDALSRVCEEYNTEFRVEGKTIHMHKLELNKEQPLQLSYGMGKGFRSGIVVRPDSDRPHIGRLFVSGGERNINPSEYGATSLQLPKSATFVYEGYTYTTDETGTFIKGRDFETSQVEESYDGSEVYPRRVGKVSKVETTKEGFVDVLDSSIPEDLNYNDFRIPGEKAVIVFLTGMLAGREFELTQTKEALTGYKHEERRFQLITAEQDGMMMPGGSYMPAVGDEYAVFGISLPKKYIEDAEVELFHEAVKYLHTLEGSPFKFEGELDPAFAHAAWLEIGGMIVPGSYIRFSDPDIYPKGEDIRITAVEFKLSKPWAAELTLTNATERGYLGTQLGKLQAEGVLREHERKAMQRAQRQDYRQALEALNMVEKAVTNMEGFTERIKPSIIETMGLLVGSEASQFGFVRAVGSLEVDTPAINYNPSTKRLTITKGVIRHQTIGITSLKNNRKPSEYRYWKLQAYTSPALTDEGKSYYIYAKVSRTTLTGNYLLSEEPIQMEQESEYYHLLVGTLSSIIDGDRAYNRLYGYTKVGPGSMVVDTISSANGAMTINLETGEIFSDKITFRRPDTQEETNLIDYIDEVQENVNSKITTAEEALRNRIDEVSKLQGEAREEAINALIADINSRFTKIQEQVDGEVSNYFYPGSPSADKLPESSWKTNNQKVAHIGDTYTSTDEEGEYMGKSWKYMPSFEWREIHDTLVSKALHLASQAQSTADGKSTTYLTKPISYNKGDSWKLEQDYTLNDKDYKAGTILYATQDSLSFVSAHWVESRYIGLDDFEVGGRNLALGTSDVALEGKTGVVGEGGGAGTAVVQVITTNRLTFEKNQSYTISLDMKVSEGLKSLSYNFVMVADGGGNLHIGGIDLIDDNEWHRYSLTFKLSDERRGSVMLAFDSRSAGTPENTTFHYKAIKLEKGNKATDWVEAPEDVEARRQKELETLEEKSKEAWESYANAQSKLAEEQANAHADGIVTAEEQARITAIQEAVNAAKLYAEEQDKLLEKTIEAYADGKVSDLESAQLKVIEAKIKLLKETMETYIDGEITEEEKARIKALEKALEEAEKKAKELVDGLEIGGRNLIMMEDIRNWEGVSFGSDEDGDYSSVHISKIYKKNMFPSVQYEENTQYTMSGLVKAVSGNNNGLLFNYTDGSFDYVVLVPNGHKKDFVATSAKGKTIKSISGHWSSGGDSKYYRLKLEKGNKKTDYTKAPEDLISDTQKSMRNLILDSKEPRRATSNPARYEFAYPIHSGIYRLSFDIEVNKKPKDDKFLIFWDRDGAQHATYLIDYKKGKLHYSTTIKTVDKNGGEHLDLYANSRWVASDDPELGEAIFSNVMLTEGNAPHTYSEAPEDIDKRVRELKGGLSNANTLISSLETITKELKSGKLDASKFEDIRYLTDALQNGETTFAGGILLTRTILLSDEANNITTAISAYSEGGGVAFEAGIKDYKQSNHTSRVIINHDGSARFGDMYINTEKEDVVKFIGKDANGTPHEYLKLGGKAPTESYMNDANTEIREFPISGVSLNRQGSIFIDRWESIESNRQVRYEMDVTATATAISVRSEYEVNPNEQYYAPASANCNSTIEVIVKDRLNGSQVWRTTSSTVSASAYVRGGSIRYDEIIDPTDMMNRKSNTSHISITVPASVIKKGYVIEVSLRVSGSSTTSTPSNFIGSTGVGKKFIPYDKSKPFIALAKDRIAFFFGRQRQILLNYASDWLMKVVGNVLVQGTVKADIVEANEWRGSGAVLAGAEFDKDGKEQKSFGRYKNRQDSNTAYAFYSYNGSYYTVYHSIPHSNYVPMLTVNESDWADMPSVSNVNAYKFRVTFNNYKGHSDKYAFSYVAFQSDIRKEEG